MKDRNPRTQELQFLIEQVELVHDIDLDEKKSKKKRERQEEKLKKIASPAKKSQVPLDTMSRLSIEEKLDILSELKESKTEQEIECERRERKKERDKLQDI